MENKEEKKGKLNEIIIESIYLIKIKELLKRKLITEEEFLKIKKNLKSF